jgi:hypothetical protein
MVDQVLRISANESCPFPKFGEFGDLVRPGSSFNESPLSTHAGSKSLSIASTPIDLNRSIYGVLGDLVARARYARGWLINSYNSGRARRVRHSEKRDRCFAIQSRSYALRRSRLAVAEEIWTDATEIRHAEILAL